MENWVEDPRKQLELVTGKSTAEDGCATRASRNDAVSNKRRLLHIEQFSELGYFWAASCFSKATASLSSFAAIAFTDADSSRG